MKKKTFDRQSNVRTFIKIKDYVENHTRTRTTTSSSQLQIRKSTELSFSKRKLAINPILGNKYSCLPNEGCYGWVHGTSGILTKINEDNSFELTNIENNSIKSIVDKIYQPK